MNENKERLSNYVVLKNREVLEMAGIEEVIEFDEEEISAVSNLGFVIIKGCNLHIEKFNTSTKELKINGSIDAIKYSDNQKKKKMNLLGRIFK